MGRQQLQPQQQRENRKISWYYYHLYGSHWTIHYSLHPTYIILKVTWHHHEWPLHCLHPCTKSSVPTQNHHIIQSTASPNCTFMLGIIVLQISWGEQMGSDTDVTTNSTRRLTSSLTNIPNIIIVSSYTPTQSYITINNTRRTTRREAKSAIDCCTVLIVWSYII